MKVKVDIPVKKILKDHGLGNDQAAAKKLANLIAMRSDKRVPMRSGPGGTLKNTVQITAAGNGVQLVYGQPYAHYQWKGEVMAGRAPKHYTGKALKHHGAPTRGPEWVDRTMKEDGDAIVADFAKAVGGRKA